MQMPINLLKKALGEGRTQVGCWLSLGSHAAAEICAGAGFDWVLIDTEHSPTELHMVHHQLQAVAPYPVSALVRAAWNDTVVIKRLLDLGAQSLLLPYVQNAEEARRAVAAVRYPPRGIRGVSANSRSNRFGRVKDYFLHADNELFLGLQLETRAALDNLEAMAAVDGVDCLFIGPQDLAADLGHLGNPSHPEVQAAMQDAIARIAATGKVPGVLAFVEAEAKRWIEAGARFVAIGSDQAILSRESLALASRFKA